MTFNFDIFLVLMLIFVFIFLVISVFEMNGRRPSRTERARQHVQYLQAKITRCEWEIKRANKKISILEDNKGLLETLDAIKRSLKK